MNVTIAKFKYDKTGLSNPVKERKVLVLSKPSDTLFGVEFEYNYEIQNVLNYMKELKDFELYLKQKYKLDNTNYKRFKENKILSLKESTIEANKLAYTPL